VSRPYPNFARMIRKMICLNCSCLPADCKSQRVEDSIQRETTRTLLCNSSRALISKDGCVSRLQAVKASDERRSVEAGHLATILVLLAMSVKGSSGGWLHAHVPRHLWHGVCAKFRTIRVMLSRSPPVSMFFHQASICCSLSPFSA
jgi:hypothetical protein